MNVYLPAEPYGLNELQIEMEDIRVRMTGKTSLKDYKSSFTVTRKKPKEYYMCKVVNNNLNKEVKDVKMYASNGNFQQSLRIPSSNKVLVQREAGRVQGQGGIQYGQSLDSLFGYT